MKRNTHILFLLSLCIPYLSYAQYPYTFAHGGGYNSSNSIVRMYDGEHAVTYYENPINGVGVVAFVDVISGSSTEVELEQGVTCYDMSITNDTVFLCGQHSVPPSNMYGCIVILPITEFYSSIANITYYRPYYWMQSVLTSIVSYTDDYYGIRIACTGNYYYNCDGTPPFPYGFNNTYIINGATSPCVENFALALTAPPHGNANTSRVMRFVNPNENPFETLYDVVATDNYVVFIGVDLGTPHSVVIHACPKIHNNIITPITRTPGYDPFSYYTKFTLNNDHGSPQYMVVALGEDSIAIAATNEDYPGLPYDIRIRTIDLNTMMNTHSQAIINNDYTELKDMTYMPDKGMLELLYRHTHYIYNDIDIFCRIDPYRTSFPYNTPAKTLANEEKYQSIHKMKYGYFIATGGDFGLVEESNSYIPNCHKELNVQPSAVTKLSPIQPYFNYDQLYPYPYVIQTQVPTIDVPIPIICTE